MFSEERKGEMRIHQWHGITLVLLSLSAVQVFAQGTLKDYENAEQFLPANVRHLVSIADVSPHWIGKTNRFWYRKVDTKGSSFILVDPEGNTVSRAFDHDKLAIALTRLTKRQYSADDLPFHDIEFVDDAKAIRFEAETVNWTCALSDYDCKESPSDPHDESLSPDKLWAAFVKDHNLYLRNVSTGTSVQLTRDGIRGWDYATPLPSLRLMVEQGTENVKQPPAVFWSPDSSKLVTYRIDSRNAGRFPSIQYVPPGQLRPKAFSVVYPLP